MSDINIHAFKGSFPALPTPFTIKNGESVLDFAAFEKLIAHHLQNGTHGLVPAGTTGESPTLSFEEHFEIIQQCVTLNNGKLPIIAGTGANSTKEAIYITQEAQKIGVDAALIVAPYYNKPTQEGIYQHFKAIHDATHIPIILYNVPGRTASDIINETVQRLYDLPRIIGIKDATGDVERISYLRHLCGDEFVIFSGEDGSALGAAAHGGNGCISVTANAAPALCAAFQNHLLNNDFTKAQKIQSQLYPLHKALFKEPNPVAIKAVLSMMNIISNEVRLPLVPASDHLCHELKDIIKNIGLI